MPKLKETPSQRHQRESQERYASFIGSIGEYLFREGIHRKEFAKRIGMVESTFNHKLKYPQTFRFDEIVRIENIIKKGGEC